MFILQHKYTAKIREKVVFCHIRIKGWIISVENSVEKNSFPKFAKTQKKSKSSKNQHREKPKKKKAVSYKLKQEYKELSEEMTKAQKVLAALGGAENVESVDACITRLRLEIVDDSKVDEERLKSLGASGVMKSGSSLQVVFGVESDQLKDKIKDLI